MPQLRKDPIIGRWVIVSIERSRRPDDFRGHSLLPEEDGECPFCEGQERLTPKEIYAVRDGSSPDGPGWKVRIIPSIRPLLKIEGQWDSFGRGMYDVLNGVGAHEVIVETPQHIHNIADLDLAQIILILNSYKGRIQDLKNDKRLKYVLIYKNYGWQAGGGKTRHARSQLIATPVNPKRVKEELVGAKRYYLYHTRCIFCDILRQEKEQGLRAVYENDHIFAFCPFASRFPFEVWLLPKRHSCDYLDSSNEEIESIAQGLKVVLGKIKKGLNDPSYNYVIHTSPFRRPQPGYWSTISEDYHWHLEITPRLTRVAGFEWGTGFYICPTPPEEAAKFLREIEV